MDETELKPLAMVCEKGHSPTSDKKTSAESYLTVTHFRRYDL